MEAAKPVRPRGRPRKNPVERAAQAPATLAAQGAPPSPTIAPAPSAAPLAATPERPAPREPARAESSREEAERYAREFEGADFNMGVGDKYYIPPGSTPDGWTYEWRTHSVVGKEMTQYTAELRRMGWRPVPYERHPDLMAGGKAGEPIVIDGMMLMERPQIITERRKAQDAAAAKAPLNNLRAKLAGSPQGTFERAPATVSTSYQPPVAIPK